MVDDSGDKTSGTPVQKSIFDSIKSALEAVVYGASNPTVSASTIIDEVVTARGSKSSLDARLDVLLNNDGTPITTGNYFTTPRQLSEAALSGNLAKNGDLTHWRKTGGLATNPDGWAAGGSSTPTLTKTGLNQADTFKFGAGPYACLVTNSSAGNEEYMEQFLLYPTDFTNALYDQVKARSVSASALVKTSTASSARICINDGVGETCSSYHTGSGAAERLEVTRTISSSATQIALTGRVANTRTAYFGAFRAVASEFTPYWAPLFLPFTRLYSQTGGGVGNVGAGADLLLTMLLPANTLAENQQSLLLIGHGTVANNANAKTVRLQFGSDVLVERALPAGAAANWLVMAIITRTGAATQSAWGTLFCGPSNGDFTAHALTLTTPTRTLTGDVTIALVGEAVANDDIVANVLQVYKLGL